MAEDESWLDDPETRDLYDQFMRHPDRDREANDIWQMLKFMPMTPGLLRYQIAEIERRAVQRAFVDTDEHAALIRGERPDHHSPLVYYMLMGTRVKIGTSTNLTSRLATFQPERLLAVEPGSHRVERERHRQFAQWRTNGEWFVAAAPLQEHVYRCANDYGELLRPWAEWRPIFRGHHAPNAPS